MDRARIARLRDRTPGAAARRGHDPLEARLRHPVFDSVRPWLDRLAGDFSLDALNRLAEERGLRTESGQPVRFAPPGAEDPYYEIHLYETGKVRTRPANWHDLFNALAWLAFPKTKARINALHAAEMPREGGRRGRVRDMLTIFDEGGAIVLAGATAESLIRQARWADLFLRHHAEFRIAVLGHAVMEQALAPHPGITCKVLFADPALDADVQAAEALPGKRSPKELPPLPIFGYPGWHPRSGTEAFYRDGRYFRCSAVKSVPGAGQAAAAPQGVEESPGSEERDAG